MNTKVNNATELATETVVSLYASTAADLGGKVKGLERARGGIWSSVRGSIAVAVENGHTAEQYKAGMAAALVAAEVPKGSITSYMDTAGKLITLIAEGKTDLQTVLKASIQEARKLAPNKRAPRQTTGKDDKPEAADPLNMGNASSARKALLSALARAVAGMEDEALAELVEYAEAVGGTPEVEETDTASEDVNKALAA